MVRIPFAEKPLHRRAALATIGGALGALVLVACGGSGGDDGTSSDAGSASGSGSDGDAAASCSSYDPEETQGPYPADGSTSANALTAYGDEIVRSDIRTSVSASGATGTDATGVLLELTLTLADYDNDCTPMADYWIYIWHCDHAGDYSLYSSGVTGENYLRGVQQTDANGQVKFITYFPACYSGRWPHIHVEIYDATSTHPTTRNKNLLRTTQLCMPEDICKTVYSGSSLYSGSSSNLSQVSLASDNVFGDNTDAQITLETPSFSGSVSEGYTATATLAYSATKS
ncbi:hypothetical protein [Solimonas soli]|uniref:dioxygenase family protein n=1 Tax=Solimonas soli TaxID=413479 RepID=UPI0004B6921A|nr:hypothetical protein [Solimonas soli]